MSRNLTDHRHQPIPRIARQIKQAKTSQQRRRTLQLQGNQALSLTVLSGYFTIDIPTTTTPEVAILDVETATPGTIVLSNLMYSVFYLESGTYVNKDATGLYPDELDIDCFLAYSSVNQGDAPMDGDDDFTSYPKVASNVARITAKIRANGFSTQAFGSWSLPGGASTEAIIFYQVRATLW